MLGLDRDGRLVVVELKRDQAPETVDMQALKYAALVSRFTYDDLAKVHAQYLSHKRGEPVTAETAASELEEWATITEESLRLPRLILLAAEFPATVTATVVFLHQQLGLDVQLRKFQAYRTGQETLVTVSQLYPPPDIEEFVLSRRSASSGRNAPSVSGASGRPLPCRAWWRPGSWSLARGWSFGRPAPSCRRNCGRGWTACRSGAGPPGRTTPPSRLCGRPTGSRIRLPDWPS